MTRIAFDESVHGGHVESELGVRNRTGQVPPLTHGGDLLVIIISDDAIFSNFPFRSVIEEDWVRESFLPNGYIPYDPRGHYDDVLNLFLDRGADQYAIDLAELNEEREAARADGINVFQEWVFNTPTFRSRLSEFPDPNIGFIPASGASPDVSFFNFPRFTRDLDTGQLLFPNANTTGIILPHLQAHVTSHGKPGLVVLMFMFSPRYCEPGISQLPEEGTSAAEWLDDQGIPFHSIWSSGTWTGRWLSSILYALRTGRAILAFEP